MEFTRIPKTKITNKTTQLTNLTEIGSYNWIDAKVPKILVPGIPKEYNKPKRLGFKLTQNKSEQFIDENHFRQPSFPTEAIFRAVKLCSPDFSFAGVDFVTDRNNLRKLLRFLNSSVKDGPFVIRTVRRGSTVVLTRVEKEDRGEAIGYGHNFEEVITREILPGGGSSFRRIVQFNLGELSLVVRTEVDGAETEITTEDNDLIQAMKNMSLEQDWKYFEDSDLQYCHKPSPNMEKRKILEFKTKNSKFAHEFDWDDTYLQMILGGVQRIVVGWHTYGKIEKIDEYLESTLQKNSPNVPRLLYALTQLLTVIKEAALNTQESEGLEIRFDPSQKDYLTVEKIDNSEFFPSNFQFQ